MEAIAQNIAAVRRKMEEAAHACGRDPHEILLCAASKMNDAARVRYAVEHGVDCCGENRVQELCEKQPLGAYGEKPVHFIGRLQTNKVSKVVGAVDLIQSVDRMELLQCIEKAAEKKGLIQDILFEVNIAAEESKAGFSAQEASALAAGMAKFPHVRLCGLMAIPPISQKSGDNLIFFQKMRTLWVDIKQKKYDNVAMEYLSMGMSDDYADAIACGSTMIRVGTAIFGARHYPDKAERNTIPEVP